MEQTNCQEKVIHIQQTKKEGTWTGSAKSVSLNATAQVRLNSITVTIGSGSKEITTTSFGDYDDQIIEITEGEEETFNGYTATLTPAEAGSITYSSDNENVAKVDATTGAITFGTEFGTAKITANFAGSDTYGPSEASYTINYVVKKIAGQVTFDNDKDAFKEVKSGGYNTYNNEPATLIGDDGQNYTFTLYQTYMNNGLQMKASVGKITSPVFEFANGYKVIVTCNTNNVNISSGELNAVGNDGKTELDINSSSASFTIQTGSKYAVVSKIEIIPLVDTHKTATTLSFPQDKYIITSTDFESPKATLTDNEGKAIEGAKITYSISGDDIATIDENTGDVTVKENTFGTSTIKASYAGDETYGASSATYTLTVLLECNNIAEVKEQKDGTNIKLNLNDAKVIYAKNNDVFIKDASGAIDLYKMNIDNLTTGKTVNGYIIATYTLFNNLPELVTNEYTSADNLVISEGEPVEPIVLQSTDNIADYTCNLVTISGATTKEGSYTYIDGVQVYDKFYIGYTAPVANANVEVTGIVIPYKDQMEICPISASDIAYTINEDKENAAFDADNANVALTRTLNSEYWNTFCVPFTMTAEQVAATFGEGTKITEFDGTVDGTIMNFKESATIEAGVPYLIKPAQTTTNPRISGVTLTAAEAKAVNSANGYAFCGTYSPKALATDGTDLFVTTEGKLNMPTAEGNTIKGMRAYITVPAGSDVKTIMLNIAGTLVGIDEIVTENADNGKIYNLNGQYVGNNADSLNKGLYIKNGKKVIIK